MPTVRVLNGPNQNQVYHLKGGELVGRDPSNEIQVFAPGVSRRHFQFKSDNGQWFVEDLGSSNGTYVNNQRIGRVALREGDTVTVGGINMRYSALANNVGPSLGSSSEEIQIGDFGVNPNPGGPPGFGASPVPGRPVPGPFTPTKPEQTGVIVTDQDDEESSADYSLDASIVFDAGTILAASGGDTTAPDTKLKALQKRLSIMFEISQALGEIQTLEELCSKMMDELFAVFPQADRGFVLVGSTVEELTPIVVRNRNATAGKDDVQLSRTIAGKILTEKQAILSQNAMEDDRFSGGMSILNFRILSMAASPILFRDEVFGLIQIDTQDRARKFTPDDLNLLAGISAQAATFIKNLKLFEEREAQEKARQNLQRYFSPGLAEKVASGEIDLKLGGETKSGTVFFSDIIGFTSMSEKMTPGQVVTKINRYMKYMVDLVFKYNGSVDKFIGDCIMAVWGVPLPMDEDAVAAVTAAVEMQNALYLFNTELAAEDESPLHMGIGLNSGSFVAGNMGSERRMEYTVIGDNVNLAQRLESKAGRGMILVSETTWEQCHNKALCCKLKPTGLKGKAKPVVTYCVRGVQMTTSSGKAYFMTSLPVAIDAWSETATRGLLVKAMLEEGGDKALGLVVLPENPGLDTLTLEFYAPEMPRYTVEFAVESELPIQAKHGVCLKGTFDYAGTPLEPLFHEGVYIAEVGPEDIPRAKTPA